jgi:hypothetical protein
MMVFPKTVKTDDPRYFFEQIKKLDVTGVHPCWCFLALLQKGLTSDGHFWLTSDGPFWLTSDGQAVRHWYTITDNMSNLPVIASDGHNLFGHH